MSSLKAMQPIGEIIWLGRVTVPGLLDSQSEPALEVRLDGVVGEVHGGLTRPSCSRVQALYPRRTPIRNTRQLSILSAEELTLIAADMGLDTLPPHLLGASMVLRGIPDFSHVPPGSRLQATGGATLVVDTTNQPCVLPGKGIEAAYPGHGARFKTAAKGRRGIVAWVEREGTLTPGDQIRLFVPDQPAWAHLDPRTG